MKRDAVILTVVGVLVSAFLVWLFWQVGDGAGLQAAGEGITVEPPGTRATAYTDEDGDRYAWWLTEYRGRPRSIEYRRESPDRITFDVEKGAYYTVQLLVDRGGEWFTFSETWPDELPDEPDEPDEPNGPGDLEGLALLAYTWGSELGSEARGEAPRIAGNFRTVGNKLKDDEYPGSSWLEKSTAALDDLKVRTGDRHADWDQWSAKWSGELNTRFIDGRIEQNIQEVGDAFLAASEGLSQVREIIQWIRPKSKSLPLTL